MLSVGVGRAASPTLSLPWSLSLGIVYTIVRVLTGLCLLFVLRVMYVRCTAKKVMIPTFDGKANNTQNVVKLVLYTALRD